MLYPLSYEGGGRPEVLGAPSPEHPVAEWSVVATRSATATHTWARPTADAGSGPLE